MTARNTAGRDARTDRGGVERAAATDQRAQHAIESPLAARTRGARAAARRACAPAHPCASTSSAADAASSPPRTAKRKPSPVMGSMKPAASPARNRPSTVEGTAIDGERPEHNRRRRPAGRRRRGAQHGSCASSRASSARGVGKVEDPPDLRRSGPRTRWSARQAAARHRYTPAPHMHLAECRDRSRIASPSASDADPMATATVSDAHPTAIAWRSDANPGGVGSAPGGNPVDAPLDVCRRRDREGLYAKADAGEIANFPGVGATLRDAAQARPRAQHGGHAGRRMRGADRQVAHESADHHSVAGWPRWAVDREGQ